MKKVLIVEDNEMNLDMLSRRLHRHGYDINTAINGEDALLKVQSYQPHLILMDMSLPIMDGWEATRRLKDDDTTRHIPIVGLSAHARPTDILRGMQSGCDAYETKPIELPRLLTTMASLL